MSSAGLSTAGAVPVINEKGEVTMQKVKVQRYVTGKKPDFESGSDSESDDDIQAVISKRRHETKEPVPLVIASTSKETQEEEDEPIPEEAIKSDRRLQRLMNRVNVEDDDDDDDRTRRRRRPINEPEILAPGESGETRRRRHEESDDEVAEDDSIERRHALIRELKQRDSDGEDDDILGRVKGDQESDDDEEEESEYEEYTDSEEESVPRLKPIFVRKEARVTAKEREIEEKKEKEREALALKEAKERREQALKMIEDDKKREEKEKQDKEEDDAMNSAINAIDTDDEGEEAETSYELWKLRELKRIKREKEEREALIKEQEEIEKLRNMTEEERQAELEKNPRIVTNKTEKSKYKFLQKYFHRGAFYIDQEHEVFKRDFAEPTLEDHHDKEVLPKVMQVKNFGRSGRTKYTHLVDQDTTARDSPWIEETPQTSKFLAQQAGGMKPIYERPSKRKKV